MRFLYPPALSLLAKLRKNPPFSILRIEIFPEI
nr:MAG TPA: hypothetical protein [Caudoviricetes sp.]